MARSQQLAQRFRASKNYLGFQILQLALCFSSIFVTLFKLTFYHQSLSIALQLCVLFFFAADFFIRYLAHEGSFFVKNSNVFDFCLLVTFIFSLAAIKVGSITSSSFTFLKMASIALTAVIISRKTTQLLGLLFKIQVPPMRMNAEYESQTRELHDLKDYSMQANKAKTGAWTK